MSVESACAAYVRGWIEIDELERRIERALADEDRPQFRNPANPFMVVRPKPWPSEAQRAFAREFARRHKGSRTTEKPMVLTGGMSWTDAPGGYSVPLMLDPHLREDQRAAVLAAERRDIEREFGKSENR